MSSTSASALVDALTSDALTLASTCVLAASVVGLIGQSVVRLDYW